MCGFVGCLSNDLLKENNINILKLMTCSIKHRGPDSEGIYFDENIFLGFRRLSIIDLEDGKQPFSYDDGDYHLVFNGEIYNYIELKERLISRNIKFKTNSEAEVILALYKHLGKSFVKELRGMFAFVIWDKKNKTLFGARDPFGIKPFYYIETPNQLYFSSELKSFSHNSDIYSKNINKQSLQNYLTFQYVPEPNTIFDKIYQLEAGSTIEKKLNDNSINIDRYWNIHFQPTKKNKDQKIEEIRNALKDSVAHHMASDVPIGSFLSGGIDSSIVATLAKEIDPNIKTFTVGFEVNGYNEIELAKETAYKLNVENISKIISVDEFVEELPNIIWHMDCPVADPAAIPLYFISREASKYVKVILSGEGSDELFGGYNIYHEPKSLKIFSYIPNSIKYILKSIANICPEGVKGKNFITRGCTPIEKRYVGNAKIFHENEKSIYIKNYDNKYSYDLITKPYYEQVKQYDDVLKMQYIDMNTWLKGDILLKSDRMSMAHSIELRVPFLDKKVFEVATKLTLEEKINGKTTKYLLREAFKDVLPQDVFNRKKLGYPVPIRCWLKNELYDWAITTVKESNTDEYINKTEVLKLIDEHRKGRIDNSRKIWTIITFMMWHKIFIEENKFVTKAV